MGASAPQPDVSAAENARRSLSHRCAGPQNAFTPFDAADIEGSIAARFEKQVARTPDALALTDSVVRWSYRELNRFANRIGAELLTQAEAREVPVAILFEHGAPAIAAMLGVLKAGRCYVPLNTHQPAARLARILKDCDAGTIVTNDRSAALARELSGSARNISIDDFGSERRDENLGINIESHDLAMILFTSGSTGAPKGVVHDQRNLLHHIGSITQCLHIDASDRFAQLYSYDSGAWVQQTFGPLLNGASGHLFDLGSRGFVDLADWLSREAITVCHTVPQVFRHLVAALTDEARFPDLRLLRLGGDTVTVADVELYRKHFSKTALLQVSMGSTEIAPIRSLFIDGDTELEDAIVPVGYAMPDIEVLILDEKDKKLPAGVAGQIAIRSEFLFRNYWRNPELTASVMTQEADGRRTLRTGDRGLLRADGCLVYLGRRDSMVKIGGLAVELAEVESALLRDGGVRQAAVIGRPDRSGETRLVAYVVGATPTRELRARLARSLPVAMIPATFVRLDSLPVNRNGKIDPSALPDPAPARYGEDPARDPLEASLVAIWEELLKIRPVGIRDDFFQLGGDSLLALELVTQIEAAFGGQVEAAILAEGPTVEQQAQILREATATRQWPAIVPLQRRGIRPPIFFVPGGGSDVVSLIGLARGIGIEQPLFGLQPPGLDGHGRRSSTVEEMATYFVRELHRAQIAGPYFLGGASYGGLVAFEMAQQLTHAGEQVAFLGLLDAHAPNFPRMHWRAPLKFRMFHAIGNTLTQRPERSFEEIAREIAGIWNARIENRRRKLRAEPLTREGRYFDSFEKALRARHRYRLAAYSGRITLFRYREQPSLKLYHPDPLMGWGPIASSLDIVDVPGTHTNLSVDDEREICAQFRACLFAAQDVAARSA